MHSSSYFDTLKKELKRVYTCAQEARSKGFDPSKEVEVKITEDVAARVEGIVGPPGIADIIRTMIKTGKSREDVAFEIAKMIAAGEIIKRPKEELIEQAVRTGLGILTEGVLVAPTEGIAKVKIRTNPDGSDFVAVYYAGPIRSAGGTAVALSVVLADIARRVVGIGDYRVTDTQMERYLEEITMYEARVAHLQYKPQEKDIQEVVRNCPVCIDGDPTEEIEVSTFRNVPGVETNRIRGGIPLVICEGIAQKAAKLLKYTKKLNLGWNWLENIIKISKKEDIIEIKPDDTYLDGLVAGRPVFSYPSTPGGFRLRYGKSKTNGLMAKNIHLATMILLENFLAIGTHAKIERPGKGCVIAPYEGLEPPVVKLRDGSVTKVTTLEQAIRINSHVVEILFLGDMLINYGDFFKSNHPLMPPGWCLEWFLKECEAKSVPVPTQFTAKSAFEFSRIHSVPLHPDYTFVWHDITVESLQLLVTVLKNAKLTFEGDALTELAIPITKEKRILEELLIDHNVIDGTIHIDGQTAYALCASLGILDGISISTTHFDSVFNLDKTTLQIVNEAAKITIKPKAPTYIGGRMGRPEKAKERKMDGSPAVLFPTGSEKNRSILKIYKTVKTQSNEKTTNLELVRMRCTKCTGLGFSARCLVCTSACKKELICQKCNRPVESEIHCDKKTLSYDKRPIDIIELIDETKKKLGFAPDDVKGVKGLSNPGRVPELIEKGFMRSKHGIYVFRDGTSRFDSSNSPLSHFKPSEIDLSVEKLKELGYEEDYLGNPLTSVDQTVPLKVQDILLSKNGGDYFVKVAQCMDELLVNVYGVKAFYNVKRREDLIGHLFGGLSPHTSAAVLCRVIGFTDANVGYAHPFFHAAKRRNCFYGDEKILVYNGKEYELLTIRELVEKNLIGETKKDDFGTEYNEVNGLKTYAFNTKTKKFELSAITHISKHKSPENLLELKTKSGRKILVTEDHTFPDSKGEKVKAKDATELLIPWKVERESTVDNKKIDFTDVVENNDLMVRTNEPIFDDETEISQVSKSLGIGYKTFTNYIYRNSYPLNIVKQFKPSILEGKNYLLANKRDKISLKPVIEMNEDFYFILGYYLAEGYTKNKQKDSWQISITAAKDWAKDILIEKINKTFGIQPYNGKNHVTICSKFIYELFAKIGVGKNARTKRVPNFIYSLGIEKINAFLRGYFSGDGSCSISSTLEVNVTSVNKWLIDATSQLLLFCGIKHSIYEEDRLVKSDLILKFYGKPKALHSYKIRLYGEEASKFIEQIGFIGKKQEDAKEKMNIWLKKKGKNRAHLEGDTFVDKIVEKRIVKNNDQYVYNLTVEKHHTLISSGITTFQCDGDEDCVMLLMDAFLNFSRSYLDEKRGGTMDAPLVLTPIMDPKEIDDEAHAIELVFSYPLDFYKAAERFAMPGEIKIKTVKDVLGTEEQFQSIPLTHPEGELDKGTLRTAYTQLESIPDKIELQFRLQKKLRAVNIQNAAERLILSHFIPDLYGNLRSFSRQTFRCVSCNDIYRRVPLAGKCIRCGGNLLLTINKGGIQKYLEISRQIARDYGLPTYLQQRLELVDKEIKSIFEDEKIKQLGLADFV